MEAGKRYYARVSGGFNRFKMNSELIVYNFRGSDDFDNAGYPVHYLYIPKNCNEIIFSDGIATARADGTFATGAFYAPGEVLSKDNYGTPLGIKYLYRIAVKPEWKGKVIACAFAYTPWSLKNLPNVVSLQKFEYNE